MKYKQKKPPKVFVAAKVSVDVKDHLVNLCKLHGNITFSNLVELLLTKFAKENPMSDEDREFLARKRPGKDLIEAMRKEIAKEI